MASISIRERAEEKRREGPSHEKGERTLSEMTEWPLISCSAVRKKMKTAPCCLFFIKKKKGGGIVWGGRARARARVCVFFGGGRGGLCVCGVRLIGVQYARTSMKHGRIHTRRSRTLLDPSGKPSPPTAMSGLPSPAMQSMMV